MNQVIKDSVDYQSKQQRVGNVVAWMDEAMLHDLIPHLKKAINEQDMLQKDNILCALLTYWSGVLDGVRFDRKSPYGENNPPLEDPNGTKVVYLEKIKGS